VASDIKPWRFDMDKPKSKKRAVGLLLVLGSILVLMAIWDLPESMSSNHGE
jgi:hypothetical protein